MFHRVGTAAGLLVAAALLFASPPPPEPVDPTPTVQATQALLVDTAAPVLDTMGLYAPVSVEVILPFLHSASFAPEPVFVDTATPVGRGRPVSRIPSTALLDTARPPNRMRLS
jgi:hypothetical protein